MRVVARLDHGVAAVELDEEIVIVAAEHEIDRAGVEYRVVLLAAGMRHRDDEIRALAAQRLGLLPDGRDRRQELQVPRTGRARGPVIGRADEPDAYAADGDDRAILEARQRLPVRRPQVGGKERKLGLAHALQEVRLAEIELVVAGRENVGRDQVGQRDDVGAVVDGRHQRRRERIAGMGEDDVAALGALGLHHRSEPREAAAALPVRHHLVAHQIDVVDQDEGDARGLGPSRDDEQEPQTISVAAASRRMAGIVTDLSLRGPSGSVCLARMHGPALSRMLSCDERSLTDCAGADIPPPAAERPPQPAGRIGVLLVNLGTPDAADAPAVRRYLKEFLSDPRVIENQGAAVEARSQRHHPAHQAAAQSPRLPQDLEPGEERIAAQDDHPRAGRKARFRRWSRWARTSSWTGRCATAIPRSHRGSTELTGRGCERILVIPLYPQYCAATTATVCDEVFRVLARMRYQPAVRIAPPYYNDPVYIEALASTTRAELARLGFEPEVILASFHGVPKDYVEKGDPVLRPLHRDHAAVARAARARCSRS